jgi:hypothetical protein
LFSRQTESAACPPQSGASSEADSGLLRFAPIPDNPLMGKLLRVLGIDIASANWAANGSALLEFDVEAQSFTHVVTPAIEWPVAEPMTPQALATAIDRSARACGVRAVSLDGPQGWRDPSTLLHLPGVGRRCEYESRTQGRTGVFPQTYPSNQRSWIQFCTQVFAALLEHPDVYLAEADDALVPPETGYAILECFPTAAWRSSGLLPLPAKSKRPPLTPYALNLKNAYGLPLDEAGITSHDDLQALVAALPAAAVVGGPAEPVRTGVPSSTRITESGVLRLEGFIWNVRPRRPAGITNVVHQSTASNPVAKRGMAALRVTQKVIEQVHVVGPSQMQLTTVGLPHGMKTAPVKVTFVFDGEPYSLVVGDTHAVWRSHQDAETLQGFESLFAQLAESPDRWSPVNLVTSPSNDDNVKQPLARLLGERPDDPVGILAEAAPLSRRDRVYVPLDSTEQWKRYLASQDHWRPGYSAYELAHSWMAARLTARGLPPSVQSALDVVPELEGVNVVLAFPEYKTALEGGARDSQTDLWWLGTCRSVLLSVAVEGKVREPFGETIAAWLAKASARSAKPRRLGALLGELGIDPSRPVDHLHYQLLHRTAAAVIEARRSRAPIAVMLVHSFHGSLHFDAYREFSALFGEEIRHTGVHRAAILGDVTLYLGWIKDAIKGGTEHQSDREAPIYSM